MLRFRHWLLALAASVPCLLLADDETGEAPSTPRVVEVVRPHFQRQPLRQPAMLETPLRLEFQIDEGEGHRFDVVCAAEDYGISVDMGNQDGENHVEVTGTVRPLDDPHRIFLSFDTTIHHANLVEGSEVTFGGNGSTIVTLGEKSRLVSFPGPVVSVTVSPAE